MAWQEEDRLRAFEAHRRYLFAVAYRLLGSAEDAEDVLQDAWLRLSRAGVEQLTDPRAYIVTIVTRLALDELRSTRARREQYTGVWLPEPVPSEEALPEDLAELSESASFAFLLLLERLRPLERAVLVLHDVFDYSHQEIGEMTGRTATASRQTLHRARNHLGDTRSLRTTPSENPRVQAVVSAARRGSVRDVMSLLAPDVVVLSDGGGVVSALKQPLTGNMVVARFLAAVGQLEEMSETRITSLNGQPAFLVYRDGALTNAVLFDATSAGITAIYVVRNPGKLRRLAALAA